MINYHGSYVEVNTPDIYHSRESVDFGKGFYITPLKEQAEKWAARFKKRDKHSIITKYELDMDLCKEYYKILEFTTYSKEWLEYIVDCRREEEIEYYDIVIGGVANDKVFNTIELYFEGLIEQEEAIKRLRFEKPNLQICIRNQSIIEKCLKFIGSEEI